MTRIALVFDLTPARGVEDQLAIVKGSEGLTNSTIEMELFGAPGAGAAERDTMGLDRRCVTRDPWGWRTTSCSPGGSLAPHADGDE